MTDGQADDGEVILICYSYCKAGDTKIINRQKRLFYSRAITQPKIVQPVKYAQELEIRINTFIQIALVVKKNSPAKF